MSQMEYADRSDQNFTINSVKYNEQLGKNELVTTFMVDKVEITSNTVFGR